MSELPGADAGQLGGHDPRAQQALDGAAVVLRPVLGQPAFAIVMLTLGVGYLARGVITMSAGNWPLCMR